MQLFMIMSVWFSILFCVVISQTVAFFASTVPTPGDPTPTGRPFFSLAALHSLSLTSLVLKIALAFLSNPSSLSLPNPSNP